MSSEAVALPEWIEEPVGLALTDLRDESTSVPVLEWRSEGDDAGVLVAGEPANASKRFEDDASVPANVVVAVAGWLQEQLYPASTVPRAEARPACPGHDHPMQARSLYDVAWWFCPESGSPVKVIGED